MYTLSELKEKQILAKPELEIAIVQINYVILKGEHEKISFALSSLIPALESYSEVIDILLEKLDAAQSKFEEIKSFPHNDYRTAEDIKQIFQDIAEDALIEVRS